MSARRGRGGRKVAAQKRPQPLQRSQTFESFELKWRQNRVSRQNRRGGPPFGESRAAGEYGETLLFTAL